MRSLAFVLVLTLAVLILVPSERDVFRALRSSAARPEMEPYFLTRLARDPGSRDVLEELIRIARARGDLAAELERRRALRALDPHDALNLEELLRVLGWLGRSEEAFELALELAERVPERRDLRERVLDWAMYAERPSRALPHARWLLERGARHPAMARVFAAARDPEGLRAAIAPPRARAQALTEVGAQAQAIGAWREHLAHAPADADARRRLARLYRWNGRPMEAAAQLEACLALEGNPADREELVELYRSLNRIDLLLAHLPAGSLERADVLAALGRVEEAWEIYLRQGRLDRLLELSGGMPLEEEELAVRRRLPPTRENRRRQADLYAWRKDFERALALYESLDDPRTVDMYLALGDFEGALAAARRLGLYGRAGDLLRSAGDLEGALAEYEHAPEMRLERIRLSIELGRRADAVRILDELAREGAIEGHVLAELCLYSGRADLALVALRRLPPAVLEAWRVERLARGAPLEAAEPLWRFLLERDPDNEDYLLALAGVLQGLGKFDEAAGLLARLLERRPKDVALLGTLGLILSDRRLLEQARAGGSKDPRVYKRLAELAREEYRRADAVRHYREYHRLRDDDPQSHFALGELTGEDAEFRRAWELLPSGERRLRARLLARWGRVAEAEALFRSAGDVEGLVDLLLGQGRLEEARNLPMTARQRADLALREGRWSQAVERLRGLDLRDPDVRSALGEALFVLGRWQEAEEVADSDLRRRIRARYGPESVVEARWSERADERHWVLSARARAYVSQPLFVRVGAGMAEYRGEVAALGNREAAVLERAEAAWGAELAPGLRLEVGVGGWRSDEAAAPLGLFEAVWRGSAASLALAGEFRAPWTDSVETVRVGGERYRAAVEGAWSPLEALVLGAGIERLGYAAAGGVLEEVDGARAEEWRGRAVVEMRFLRGDGAAGGAFFDAALREGGALGTYLAMAARFEVATLEGDDALLNAVQRVTRLRTWTVGPTAGWAAGSWGVAGSAYAGADGERDLGVGALWGGSVSLLATWEDRWKAFASGEYVSESALVEGGRAWAVTLGLQHNF